MVSINNTEVKCCYLKYAEEVMKEEENQSQHHKIIEVVLDSLQVNNKNLMFLFSFN